MNVVDAARAWLAQDPDPETRAELEPLIVAGAAGDPAALADLMSRFDGRLAFGTAGLRAGLGAGPLRMNRVVVAQAAAGLAAHLRSGSVVVGYDGRRNSEVFARDVAEIVAGAGLTAILLPRALPTPVLAFAVRHFDASAGVMVTASHNPRDDNGLKVYLGGEDAGSQIVPPADREIAAAIAAVSERPVTFYPRSTGYRVANEEVVEAYVHATCAAVGTHVGPQPKVVYSAMHGVGWPVAARVFEAAGFTDVTPVLEQIDPDPAFPTAPFPNPEEPGAMDLALALAATVGADVAIVNDPDADRVAVGVPGPDGWRRLTGNDVGLILAWREALEGDGGVLASSLVSSPGLARIAERFGYEHVETLTGFKWISRVPGLVYGYEEALGYLVDPEVVRDKDGVSAALSLLRIAASLAANGRTFDDLLEEIATAVGGWASGQVSIRVRDLAEIGRMTARVRAVPPLELAGRRVVGIRDWRDDAEHPSDILRLDLEDGSRVIVRPSGTEPKLKVYLDACAMDGSGAERLRAARAAVAELEDAVRAMLA